MHRNTLFLSKLSCKISHDLNHYKLEITIVNRIEMSSYSMCNHYTCVYIILHIWKSQICREFVLIKRHKMSHIRQLLATWLTHVLSIWICFWYIDIYCTYMFKLRCPTKCNCIFIFSGTKPLDLSLSAINSLFLCYLIAFTIGIFS